MIWLLQECKDLDWDIKVYKREATKLAPPSLKEIHPLGKSPLISVEAPSMPKPLVLAESGAIVEYVCDHFAPHLVPTRYQEGKEGQVGGESEQWIRHRFFMHYAEGSLMTILLIGLFMDSKQSYLELVSASVDGGAVIRDGPAPFFIKPITRGIAGRVDTMFLNNEYKTHFSFLEQQVATSPEGGKWLCGKEMTAADILMSFPLIAGRKKMDRSKYPKLLAYVDMMEASEGYQASIKKAEEATGEPFEAF